MGAITEGTGNPPAADGKDRGAPAPARAPEQADSRPSSEGGPKPKPSQSEAATTDDPWKKFVTERHGGDEEKAKRAVYETDSRAAQLARELAEEKAKHGTAPDSADPDAPTTTDEPEITEEAFTAQLAAAQQEFVSSDPECGRLVDQYKEAEPVALAFGKPTREGHFVGGSVEKIQQEILLSQRNLERGRVGGHELDEVEKSELRDEIRNLKDSLRDERDAANVAWRRVRNLTDDWDRRIDAYQRQFQKDWTVQAQAVVRERNDTTSKKAAEQEWFGTFAELKPGLSEQDADDLETDLLLRAAAIYNTGGHIPDLKGWMKDEAEKIHARNARRGGEVDRTRTEQQLQTSRRPTPGGNADLAPAPALTGTARERRRAADLRSAGLARAAGAAR